jgi:hypothetical protein
MIFQKPNNRGKKREKFSYNNLQQKLYIWLKAFLRKKKKKKTFTQNDKHKMSPTTPASPSSPKQPLLQEMLILAQSISSSAQYVTLKKRFSHIQV